MKTGQTVVATSMDNPAAAADADQHARQEIARLAHQALGPAARVAAAAVAALAIGWLLRRRSRT
jgi:hypothetical protein